MGKSRMDQTIETHREKRIEYIRRSFDYPTVGEAK